MSEQLPFTGERFTPECVREIWYEHWHRYAFALPVVRGRTVLDAACGEGYGSNLLARTAAAVTGLDVSAEAVAHARTRYAATANLRYECGDALDLPFADASFDVVVSFETLEHLHDHERLLGEFLRVLRPAGILLISSPDRHTYSDVPGFRNEHHVHELYRDEFEALLAARFVHRRLYGQKLLFASALWSLDGGAPRATATTVESDERFQAGLALAPLYFIAACSNAPDGLPAELDAQVSLFTDVAESVYAHYNHEVRKNMAAGGRIAELEAQLAALQAQLKAQAIEREQWQHALAEARAAEAADPQGSAVLPHGEHDHGNANHRAPLLSLRRWFSRR